MKFVSVNSSFSISEIIEAANISPLVSVLLATAIAFALAGKLVHWMAK